MNFQRTQHALMAAMICTALAACGSDSELLMSDTTVLPNEVDTGNNPPIDDQKEEPEVVFTPRAPLAAAAADPSESNPSASITRQDYDFGRLDVSDSVNGNTYQTDIHGYFAYDENATGPMPVILLMHGRHQTCETDIGQLPVLIADDDQCINVDGVLGPADSYKGYEYLVDNLASHGYFVMSVDANDINDNDGAASAGDAGAQARAQLIQAHLDEFREINDTGAGSLSYLQGKLDMDHIGTMGHSRGGDGVARFLTYNAMQTNPHKVVATFALAPTDYNTELVGGHTFATLLPYCDGDVEDLQGAFMYDDARYQIAGDTKPKFQILTMGSNHNYFNTVWTSDDWTITDGSGTDPFCGTNSGTDQRDTPEEQRALGLFFMASFFRHFVGNETEFAAYWNGKATVPDFACPGGQGPCEERHHLSVFSKAADRLVINSFSTADNLQTNDLGGSVVDDGLSSLAFCDPDRTGEGCPSRSTFSYTPQAALSWDTTATLSNSFDAVDARLFDLLSVRVAVSTLNSDKTADQDFVLVLTDAEGLEASLLASDYTHSLYNPPGNPEVESGSQKTILNAIDFPLAGVTGVDLSQLVKVTLRFDQTAAGALQVSDLMLLRTLNTLPGNTPD